VVAGAVLSATAAALAQVPSAQAAPPEGKKMKDARFVVFHTPGPKWQAGKTLFDQPGVMEHVGHYNKLLEAGKLGLGGPHLDQKGGGMMIPSAGVSEAEISAFAADDPAVKSGVLRFEVRPWLIGMSA
jgi:uncharacterized protein YciI